MKPLGTITKYYKFIDEKSESILDSLMEESSSYFDFVLRLGNLVLERDATVPLIYIATVQVWWTRIEDTMSLIQEKYKEIPCIRPWGYLLHEGETDQIRYHDDVVEAIDKAIDTSLDDWMEVELHLLHTFFHWPYHCDVPSYLQPLDKAKNLVDANPLLNCFKPLICAFEGFVKRREGNVRGSLVLVQKGQELAEAYDDSLYKYMNLLEYANSFRTIDIQESLKQFEELYDLAQDLEVPYLLAEVLNDSANAFEIAGEYDLAISSHYEIIKILGQDFMSTSILSRIYAVLGDGQQALEWINRAYEFAGSLEISILHLRKAWALALLNRLEEAERCLFTAHPQIIKTGQEIELGIYYYVSGVIELAREKYLVALDFLEKAHEISERLSRGIFQNNTLLELARVEIALVNQSTTSSKVVTPGRWLSKLESHSVEHDLPGIRMYAALLKSEFYQKHNQLRDAFATLQEALNVTDSPGVNTLRKRISARIQKMKHLIRDDELMS